MADTKRRLEIKVDQTGNADKGLSSLIDKLKGVAGIAGGVALSGVLAFGAGVTGVGIAGLSMNNSMEKARARINAFTKDGKKTADILEMIRTRAAKTPFEFQAMADAAAALLPSSKQAQVGLEDLIKQAEILAASNPAEGLEGAAFALKEAVSGDFTSIVERFNLPRQFINQLKEEGVPALEIVSRAMQELGLDADLVGAMAETAEGRWSTFKDTLQGLAARITQPIFDTFSGGLGKLNEKLEAAGPTLDILAGKLAEAVQAGLDFSGQMLTNLTGWIGNVTAAYQEGGISGVTEMIKADLALLGNSINTEVQKYEQQFWAWLDDTIAKAPANFALLQNTIRTQIAFAWPGIKAQLSQWGTEFWGWTGDAATQVDTSLRSLSNSVRTWVDSHNGDIQNSGETFGAYLYDGLTALLSNGEESDKAISAWISSLGKSVVNLAGSLITIGLDFASGFINAIIEKWSGAETSDKLRNEIKNALTRSLVGWNPLVLFTPVGRSAIDGIIQGIEDGIDRLKRAAENAARRAYNAMMSYLKAGSPSELIAKNVGETAIGGGVVEGMQRAGAAITGAAQGMLGGAVSTPVLATGATASGGGGAIIVNLTYAPTISTADRYEAEQVLGPFIADGVRNYLAGKR